MTARARRNAGFMATVACLLVGPLPHAHAASPDGIAGRVVDASGAPVASARVWVISGSWDRPKAVADAVTDPQGTFAFPHLWKDAENGDAERRVNQYTLTARDGRGRLGWRSNVFRGDTTSVELKLLESADARARLVDHTGKPIAGAEVGPIRFIRSGREQRANDFASLTPALARPFAATTADDGSIALHGIPRGCEVVATLRAHGFGTPQVSWDSTRDVTIVLDRRVGRIEGRLVTPDSKPLGTRLTLHLRRQAPARDVAEQPFQLLYFAATEVGDDGRFRFDELPPGRYTLTLWAASATGYADASVPDVEVAPGADVADVRIPLKRLAAITGRVVDAVSGAGIAGVSVQAALLDDQFRRPIDNVQTDAQGRFTAHVPRGKVLIYTRETPKSHLELEAQHAVQADVTADREWPDLKLTRAVTLDGIVVDASGAPVEGAEVHVVTPRESWRHMLPVRTGKDGTFRLDRLDPDDTLPLRARTRAAATDGAVVVRPGKPPGKVTLQLDPRSTSHVHGVIADSAGKPVAGAAVHLWWGRDYVSEKTSLAGVGNVLETYKTGADGRFASSALWPGDDYHVLVDAEGYGRAESPRIEGKAGDDHDFGTIALLETRAQIVGRVVDTDGRPVAGVTVFNRGDSARPISTQTDAAGRFRLAGVFAAGAHAFARKEGFRFTGVRVDGKADGVTIALRRTDEPPPPWTAERPPTAEEGQAMAKRLLTKLWERYGKNGNKNGAFVCILDMARLDPELALRWSAQLGGRYDGRVRQEAAEVLAETDGDGALELLTTPGVRGSQYTLQRLAERFAATDPARALKFAGEGAVQARAMEQPDRAGAMARAGAVLVRLGRRDAGLALIREAADAAERMGAEGRQAYARGNVAGALAPFDLARALALVEPVKEEDPRDRYLGFIASGLAPTDPEKALAVVEKIGKRTNTRQAVKVEIAYTLGTAGRLDDAVRVLEGIAGYGSAKDQCEGYAWLAVAAAPRDPARAAGFIDRALASPVDQPGEFASWTNFGGGTAVAAWTLACARRAGYPDMAGAVARVLAARPSDPYRDPSIEAQSLTVAATILALTDPASARQVLRDVQARSGDRNFGRNRRTERQWLMAWAIADPKHAEELFNAQLAALEKERDVDLQNTGLLKMAEVLAQPPARREELLRREIGASWYPGIEN